MTDKQKLAMQALSQDLYRVAVGRYRGQKTMATRFTDEAKNRLREINDTSFREKIQLSLNSTAERSAEDLLMYSVLARNRAK